MADEHLPTYGETPREKRLNKRIAALEAAVHYLLSVRPRRRPHPHTPGPFFPPIPEEVLEEYPEWKDLE